MTSQYYETYLKSKGTTLGTQPKVSEQDPTPPPKKPRSKKEAVEPKKRAPKKTSPADPTIKKEKKEIPLELKKARWEAMMLKKHNGKLPYSYNERPAAVKQKKAEKDFIKEQLALFRKGKAKP